MLLLYSFRCIAVAVDAVDAVITAAVVVAAECVAGLRGTLLLLLLQLSLSLAVVVAECVAGLRGPPSASCTCGK